MGKTGLAGRRGAGDHDKFHAAPVYDALGNLADLTLLLRFLYQDQFTQRPTADLIIQITYGLNTDLFSPFLRFFQRPE